MGLSFMESNVTKLISEDIPSEEAGGGAGVWGDGAGDRWLPEQLRFSVPTKVTHSINLLYAIVQGINPWKMCGTLNPCTKDHCKHLGLL
jgi:hypothetical protein